jgi:post-GPI attachment to proteins factor 3
MLCCWHSVFLLTAYMLISCNVLVLASMGDRSEYYYNCMKTCKASNCTNDRLSVFDARQPLHLKLLGWECVDECKYECMWATTNWFMKHRQRVPQFYGKWPFVRIFGVQEPASAFASILNLLSHFNMINKMNKKSSPKTHFRDLWNLFGLLSINAWLWSTIFHTRDFGFTEKMDYFSGFALVLYQFNSFFIRMFRLNNDQLSRVALYTISVLSLLYFVYHVNYLSTVSFDYGYNMKVNITIGFLNSICWLAWSFYKYFYTNSKYVYRCALSVLLIDLSMVLEIFDFSPLLWLFDSHALWHFSTIFIPYFWYQFLIDDNYQVDLASYKLL